MKKISIILICTLACNFLFAAKTNIPLSKDSLKSYKTAVKQGDKFYRLQDEKKYQACGQYLTAYNLYAGDASLCYKLGNCYLTGFSKTKAITFFDAVADIDSTHKQFPDIYWKLGTAYQLDNQFDNAIVSYQNHKDILSKGKQNKKTIAKIKQTDKRIQECQSGLSLEKIKNPLFIDNVSAINTSADEYNTICNPNGKTISYTNATLLSSGERREHSLSANKSVDGTFDSPYENIAKKRKFSHIDVVAQTDNGNTEYVYDGDKSAILIYKNKDGKWRKSGKLKFWKNRVRKIGFNSNCEQIVFSSEGKKSLGEQDLFIVNKNGKKWTKPENLGNQVNTEYDETAPVFVNDSTIYFSSTGHNSMGGYDIFKTTLSNGKWGQAENIGTPINTAFDDVFYTPTNKDLKAYISSNRDGGKGGMDIYALTYILPKELAEDFDAPAGTIGDKLLAGINIQQEANIDSSKVTLMKGIIMGDDSLLLKAKIELADNELQQIIATFEADSTGNYEVILPGGLNYGISVSYPGYLFHSENFDLPEQSEFQEIDKDIILKKIAIGKNIVLKNIFFETAKADLNDESIIELNNVIKLLKENPTMHVEISGHTDNVGSKAYNKNLSNFRAKSVVDYLIQNGIEEGRLTSKGYGYDNPVASNKTEEGRKENRRIEFLITKI